MFDPKYTITPKLLENIKRIGVIVADLNNWHFSTPALVKLEERAREVSTYSSTSIEGNSLPLTDVKRIIQNQPENLRDSEREVINYNQALKYLSDGIEKNTLKLNLRLILKIQKLVTNRLINAHDSGKLREQPIFVNNPQTRQAVYLPPNQQEAQKLVNDLVVYIATHKTKLDPLILAGLFHKQFVIIHPFIDGNGRTARLATKVLLAGMGLNTFNLFSFENYYNQNVTKYFANVGLLGNYYDLVDRIDFTSWLEYFTDGIIDELLRVSKLLENEIATPATSLKPHHQQVLDYIKENGFISDRDYALLTTRAKPTRNQDFNKLIDLGLIIRLGKSKATYYKFKNK